MRHTASLRVAIRCDGHHAIGMGHVMECLSLARSLRRDDDCEVRFLLQAGTPAVTLVEREGWPYDELTSADDEGMEQEVEAIVRQWKPDVVGVDLPRALASPYEQLRLLVPCLMAVFDDGDPRPFGAHCVVDYSIIQSESEKPGHHEAIVQLRGPSFALLDETLHDDWCRPQPTPNRCRRLLISQGGSDPFGLTLKLLNALDRLRLDQELIVVLGPAVSPPLAHEVALRAAALSAPCRVECAVVPERFRALMRTCDLAITAAGNTLYELCAMGRPAVVVCHHERHDAVASAFAARGAVVNLGIGTALSEEVIAAGIQRVVEDAHMRAEMVRNGQAIVDGLGCARVAAALITHMVGRE